AASGYTSQKTEALETAAHLADRSQASIVANQICRLKRMLLNKITSDIRRSRQWPRTVRIGFTSKQRKAILRVSAGKRFSGMQRFRSDRFATGRADHRAAFLFLLVSESHH